MCGSQSACVEMDSEVYTLGKNMYCLIHDVCPGKEVAEWQHQCCLNRSGGSRAALLPVSSQPQFLIWEGEVMLIPFSQDSFKD